MDDDVPSFNVLMTAATIALFILNVLLALRLRSLHSSSLHTVPLPPEALAPVAHRPTRPSLPPVLLEKVQKHVPDPRDALSHHAANVKQLITLRRSHDAAVRQQSPREILSDLQEGNLRFWSGCAQKPCLSALERQALLEGQAPKVAIVGCADSRVPVEMIFDQGIGDVFCIRVAGSLCSSTVAASIEYAVHHLGVKLIVVLGHEGCGAVTAAQLPDDKLENEPPSLRDLLRSIKADLEPSARTLAAVRDPRARNREAVTINTLAQVRRFLANEQMRQKLAAGELLMVSAFYNMTTGVVDFMDTESTDTCSAEGRPAASDATSLSSASSSEAGDADNQLTPRQRLARQVPLMDSSTRAAAAA
eukprot:CAMPEP_0119412670 /NCGR_PEP_ID=MMETSP1335-20130426/5023_1 /TAXON_ID=259385 /ORGANISM="Chrysoculter rhomboideus, Strain RCC1486" /LENGTH=361 /DNA_ID=CAMNT_0007437421 /DNA_START=51 /DNA_END=1136 /DNA_ORIENTATION=+